MHLKSYEEKSLVCSTISSFGFEQPFVFGKADLIIGAPQLMGFS